MFSFWSLLSSHSDAIVTISLAHLLSPTAQGVLLVLLKLPQTSCPGAGGEFTSWFEGLLSPTESTILNQILLEAVPFVLHAAIWNCPRYVL